MFSPGVVQKGVEVAADSDAGTAASDAAAGAAADAASSAADAVTAASGAAADTASAAADAVTAASGAAADTAAEVTEAAGQVFGKIWDTGNNIIPWDSAFVTWFRETFMDGMVAYVSYPLFQVMIVVVELGIGLALIGGLFTWIAAAVSIIMCFVFTFSGMFSWNQVWFIFAAFLMLGGAGRSFGLDHWVMPAIRNWWNSTRIARRTHLFIGEPRLKKK
jgi:NADH dehydrogenase